MNEFWGILIVGLWFSLLGNMTRDVYIDQIAIATAVCAPHGGVRLINGNIWQSFGNVEAVVTCMNGTKVTAVTTGRVQK